MNQHAATSPDASAAPNGRRLLLFAQIAAVEIYAAVLFATHVANLAVGLICVGVFYGAICFIATLVVLSRSGLLTRIGLLAALSFDASLLTGELARFFPLIVLQILSAAAAASLWRFAGLRIVAAPPAAVATRARPMQFGLLQLLAAVTACGLVMGALRIISSDYSPRDAFVGIQTLVGSLVAIWAIYGRARWTWRVAGLGLTLMQAFAVDECTDRLIFGEWNDAWVTFSTFCIALILSTTAMLGFARCCGYRGHWIGKAALVAPLAPVNASENAGSPEHP